MGNRIYSKIQHQHRTTFISQVYMLFTLKSHLEEDQEALQHIFPRDSHPSSRGTNEHSIYIPL